MLKHSNLLNQMFIKNYKSFLEARLSDILKVKSTGGESDRIQKYIDMDFDFSKRLLKYVTLKRRVDKRKVQFTLNWNDNVSHDLKKRIKERTSFKSIEEFNDLFKSIIIKVFPSMVGKELISNGKYSLYSVEYNISIIIYFNINKYINKDYELTIKTVLPGKKGENIVNLIEV